MYRRERLDGWIATCLSVPRLQREPGVVAFFPLADPHVQALLNALVLFRPLPHGFTAPEFRQHLAPLLGLAPTALTPSRATYDVRRLRLRGLIARIPKTPRYRLTAMASA